jgi:GNAT superfamily N-acetyltransferase
MVRGLRDRSLSPYRRGMLGNLEIGTARPDEYRAAGEVTALAYLEHAPPESAEWAAYLERIGDVAGRAGRTTVLVAREGTEIVGTATIELDRRIEDTSRGELGPDEAHLRMLGVDPEHRRQGIARKLVEASIELARAHGKHRLTLETTSRMRAARTLYESMGFTPTGATEVRPGLCFDGYELRLDAP